MHTRKFTHMPSLRAHYKKAKDSLVRERNSNSLPKKIKN